MFMMQSLSRVTSITAKVRAFESRNNQNWVYPPTHNTGSCEVFGTSAPIKPWRNLLFQTALTVYKSMVYGIYQNPDELSLYTFAFPAEPGPVCSIFSALRLRKLRYVCQHTAKTPLNMNRYCGIINAKLKAVTAGHNFKLFHMLVGTVSLIRLITPDGGSPVITACIPKKYVLNTGVKTACWTATFTAIEPHLEA